MWLDYNVDSSNLKGGQKELSHSLNDVSYTPLSFKFFLYTSSCTTKATREILLPCVFDNSRSPPLPSMHKDLVIPGNDSRSIVPSWTKPNHCPIPRLDLNLFPLPRGTVSHSSLSDIRFLLQPWTTWRRIHRFMRRVRWILLHCLLCMNHALASNPKVKWMSRIRRIGAIRERHSYSSRWCRVLC